MRNRGVPYHPDADKALAEVVRRINGYKGHPMLQPEPLAWVQKTALDALALAPTPVGESWHAATMSALRGLAEWAYNTGQPLTNEHLLAEETRYRFNDYLNSDTKRAAGDKNGKWGRLELIADFLLGATPRELPKPTDTDAAPREPLTSAEQADLWLWAKTLNVDTQAKRLTAMLTLGLGCGLTGGELPKVRREDVRLDDDGSVHVTVVSNKSTRTVTCLAAWETRLAAIVAAVPANHYVLTPWREAHSAYTHNESIQRALAKNPPAAFNSYRLRNTWLCWHLTHGTPLKELMAAADMREANHLHNLLPLLPEPDPQRTARVLRGQPVRPPITIPVPDTDLTVTVAFENGFDRD